MSYPCGENPITFQVPAFLKKTAWRRSDKKNDTRNNHRKRDLFSLPESGFFFCVAPMEKPWYDKGAFLERKDFFPLPCVLLSLLSGKRDIEPWDF
jgi:hypothetical protein